MFLDVTWVEAAGRWLVEITLDQAVTRMKTIMLRPIEPERDFGQLAVLFTREQDGPTTEPGLKTDYEQHKERIFCLMAAEDEQGELMGFNWATRSRVDSKIAYFYVIVRSNRRREGAGGQLYAAVEQAALAAGIQKLVIEVRDTCPEGLAFAVKHGFSERTHSIGMALDLDAFDDRLYDATIARLEAAGFRFTTMEALGNTESAQRQLYVLNDTAAAETPGSDGSHSWASFEDFQQSVCQSDWYIPAGQIIAIDTATGNWAGMSAITRFAGADYAYNLFTGVDRRYRGRKLAQAVKVLALRYARAALGVNIVRTNHNTLNAPMIAIDRKFGYLQTPGWYNMEKSLA